jgi:hypothetical protein
VLVGEQMQAAEESLERAEEHLDADLPPLNVATFRERVSGWSNQREGNRCHEERTIRRSRSSANSGKPRSSWPGGRRCLRWSGSVA